MGMSRRREQAVRQAYIQGQEYLKRLFIENNFNKPYRELFYLLIIKIDLNGIIILSQDLKVRLTDRFDISMGTLTQRIVFLIEKGFFVLNTPTSLRLNANQGMFCTSKIINLIHKR
jgi:hypothetical protein